eukprot:TRINITY_DN4751_c0_g1_i1.p1 TRINITY_DN4751_c0_g1~~TRINITY_DN4751_c0_g1_i1.p1  ORF type:complete len:657 (-),score=116.51 TRINITY_DN4751_c0_g1_i1:104-1972(-)
MTDNNAIEKVEMTDDNAPNPVPVHDALPAKIVWKNRPPMSISEKMCGGLFYAQLVLQLVLGLVMIGMKNAYFLGADDSCPSGWTNVDNMCYSEALVEKQSKCETEHFGFNSGRSLAEALETDMNLWDALDEFPAIPIVLFASMIVLACVWLTLLRLWARLIVWTTIGIGLVSFIYLGFRPCFDGYQPLWAFIVFFAILVGVVIWKRTAVDKAVIVISVACQGLQETPSIFFFAFIPFVLFGGYVCVWAAFMIQSATVWDVYQTDGYPCTMGPSSFSGQVRIIFAVLFTPTMFFLKNAMLILCATGIGGWYFDDADAPANSAAEGLKWAFTTSSGASFMAAVVMYLTQEIRKRAQSPLRFCCCFFPLHTILWMTYCMIGSCIRTMTRYMLIAHTFHGGDFLTTGKNAWTLLSSRLGDAAVNDTIASGVLNLSTSLFSVAFGFIAWAWLDEALGVGILVHVTDSAAESASSDILFVFLVLFMAIFVLNPIFSLILLAVFGSLIKLNVLLGFLGGVFIGSICCIFFRYFSTVVLACTDTIFFAFALEAEASKKQERFQRLYGLIETYVVGVPVAPGGEIGQKITVGTVQNGEGQVMGAPSDAEWQAEAASPNVVVDAGNQQMEKE